MSDASGECKDDVLATAMATIHLEDGLLTKGRPKELGGDGSDVGGGGNADRKLHKTQRRTGESQHLDFLDRLLHSEPARPPEGADNTGRHRSESLAAGGFVHDELDALLADSALTVGAAAWQPPASPFCSLPDHAHSSVSHHAHSSLSHHAHSSVSHYAHSSLSHHAHSSLSHHAHGSLFHHAHGSLSHHAHSSLSHHAHGSLSNGAHCPLPAHSDAPAGPSRTSRAVVAAGARAKLRDFVLHRTGYNQHLDSDFNSPLHTAIEQKRSRIDVELTLRQLKEDRALQCVINLVNRDGETALSLCLKHRRPELVQLLTDYGALPTSHCGQPKERTNHFHCAVQRCLEAAGLDTAWALLSAVQLTCWDELVGLAARNCDRKTPLEELELQLLKMQHEQLARPSVLHQVQQLQCQMRQLLAQMHLGGNNSTELTEH